MKSRLDSVAAYTVKYDSNGAVSGSVPVDTKQYPPGGSAVIPGNTGSMSRPGFAFTGWNTAADGSGATYSANGKFIVNANATFYAKWQTDTTNPTIGTVITFLNVTSSKMTVSWGAGNDNISAASDLQYRLVKAGSMAAIDTITEVDAISGADLLMDYGANTTSFLATGLTPTTTYFFAVVVRDGAGLKALYTPQSQVTTAVGWAHEAYLKSPKISGQANFGYSVSASGDTIVLGAKFEASNTTVIINGSDLSSANNSGQSNGAAHVFKRNGSAWAHEAYLKAPNNSDLDAFGYSVSISEDTIVVGASDEDSNTTLIINGSDLATTNNSGNGNGAAYVFRRTGLIWSHEAYLKAPNSSNDDGFGYSVAIYGDTIVASAPYEASNTTAIINGNDLSTTNDAGESNGAAYIFRRSGSTWSHEAFLKAPNNSNSDNFGNSVSISGDTIVVAAPGESSDTTAIINGSDLSTTNNSGNNNGAAYVFKRTGSTWSHEAYLKAPNNSNSDNFGSSVSISGDTIVVGAIMEDSSTIAIINGSDLSATNNSGNNNGAAYVFKRTGSTWGHEAYLKAPNNSNSDQFGHSVSISGDTIVVGARLESSNTTAIISGSDLSATNDSGNSNGAAYVFKRSGSTWSHETYLKAPNSSNVDQFGWSVSIAGDTIAVGAPQEDSSSTGIIQGSDLSATNDLGDNNGAVYVFTRQ